MTLTELRYVVAVAETRHFGRAAERCHVSQPSLSASVKNLEEELGVKLFERGKRGVLVTEPGEQILAQARRALEEAERVKTVARQGRDPLKGVLRLGIIHTIAPYLLPDLVRALRKIERNATFDVPSRMEAFFIENPVSNRLTGLLATHPPIAERIEALQRYAGAVDVSRSPTPASP